MTKFEDLLEIISRNKNKGKKSVKTVFTEDKDNDVELEVSGSGTTRAPLVAAADGLIGGTAGDYNQAPPSGTTAKNTYQ